jgi:hypothetical protein
MYIDESFSFFCCMHLNTDQYLRSRQDVLTEMKLQVDRLTSVYNERSTNYFTEFSTV